MRRNLFWLNDEQWRQIEPHLPKDVRGKQRVDDRRVISGIVHVLKSGCRWCDCPPEYGPSTKIYTIADAKGRLLSILLSGGEAHDCPPAQRLIRRCKTAKKLLGDKAYDSAELRRWLNERGTRAVIPNRSNRKQFFRFHKKSYKQRHLIENAFCRLKDFRRIATRYDRLARNFLASVCLVAAIVWWIL